MKTVNYYTVAIKTPNNSPLVIMPIKHRHNQESKMMLWLNGPIQILKQTKEGPVIQFGLELEVDHIDGYATSDVKAVTGKLIVNGDDKQLLIDFKKSSLKKSLYISITDNDFYVFRELIIGWIDGLPKEEEIANEILSRLVVNEF